MDVYSLATGLCYLVSTLTEGRDSFLIGTNIERFFLKVVLRLSADGLSSNSIPYLSKSV